MKIILKDRCVMCNSLIEGYRYFGPQCVPRFWDRGNYCTTCNGMCGSLYQGQHTDGDIEKHLIEIAIRKKEDFIRPRIIEIEVPEYNVMQKYPILEQFNLIET